MEREKLKRRERDFENRRGRHGGGRKRKYAYEGAGRYINGTFTLKASLQSCS